MFKLSTLNKKFYRLICVILLLFTAIVFFEIIFNSKHSTDYPENQRLNQKRQITSINRGKIIHLNKSFNQSHFYNFRSSKFTSQNLFNVQNLTISISKNITSFPIFPSELADPNSDDRILYQMIYIPKNVLENNIKATDHLINLNYHRFIRNQQRGNGLLLHRWDSSPNTVCRLARKTNSVKWKTIQFYHSVGGSNNLAFCPVFECSIKYGSYNWQKADLLVLTGFRNPHGIRPLGQAWMLFLLESPYHSGAFGSKSQVMKVNFTATYRRDSTLVTPYYKYVQYEETGPSIKSKPINYAAGKTKKIAWFVSNCHSHSPRMEYAKQLKKFIEVDIYGSCGTLVCSYHSENCFKIIQRDYKFYLSFENSLCKDYITEKYFLNALGQKAIPIVMGASRQDYEHVSPPNSFIHVNDYPSPEALAKYLQYLDQNDTAYNAYFAWRENSILDLNTFSDCRMCMLAHEMENIPPMWYDDVQQWWFEGCQKQEPIHMKI